MILLPEDILKLVLAVLMGGLIGAEREYRDKAAGFRTIIFICVGATLFTIFSLKLGGESDPVRIAANIVSGVGFLGAGTILRDAGRVVGLTTASTIWLAAGVGMGIGGGYLLISAVATGVVLVVLWLFPLIERLIDDIRHTYAYEVVFPIGIDKYDEIRSLFEESGLRVNGRKRVKSGDDMICTWDATGSPKAHEKVVDKLLVHSDVKEFKV
jgi:putative Mg2+ transporter-C (MgtC) family protein